MKRAEINVLEGEFLVEITAIVAVVKSVGRGDVEASLAAPGYHVVGIDGLDECAHFVDPGRDGVGCAGGAAGEVTHAVGAAAWFVGEFPGEDAGGVGVALDNLPDVVFVGGFDFGVAVELGGISRLPRYCCFWVSRRRGTFHRD